MKYTKYKSVFDTTINQLKKIYNNVLGKVYFWNCAIDITTRC